MHPFWRRLIEHFVPSRGNDYHPHLLRRPWLVILLALTLASEGFLVADLVARQGSENFLAAVVPGEIIALTNSERAQNNDGALTENADLDAAAQAKAQDMAAKGYFSHTGPDGKTPWQWIIESGYQYQYAGENLAVRFVDSSDVVNAWMASPTHRENIVKPVYTQIGVGVAQGMYDGQPATYVVQYFGTPLAAGASAPQRVASAPVASAPVTHAAAAPASQPAQPTVEGASIAVPVSAPAPSPGSFAQSFARGVMRALAEPGSTTNALLGATLAVLVVALFMTFFVHVHIQHPRALASGMVVAGMAALFLILNFHLAGLGAPAGNSQAASVIEAGVPGQGVVIDDAAAAVGFATFPQSP